MSYEVFDRLCKQNNVRPADVSRATGISTATLSSWKKGRYTPKPDKIRKIADYFGVPLEMFYGQSDDRPQEHYGEETLKLAQTICDNPDLRKLLEVAMEYDPDQIESFVAMLYKLNKRKGGKDGKEERYPRLKLQLEPCARDQLRQA